MPVPWHGVVGSVGIIGVVAAPGVLDSAQLTEHSWLRSERTPIH
jgi:hypothetical protein